MRVMCISEKWIPAPWAIDKPRPKFGDIDAVICITKKLGNEFYELERFGKGSGYATDHFIPLDDEPAEIEDVECEVLETQPA